MDKNGQEWTRMDKNGQEYYIFIYLLHVNVPKDQDTLIRKHVVPIYGY